VPRDRRDPRTSCLPSPTGSQRVLALHARRCGPFLEVPVSSTTSAAPGSPSCLMTKPRTSSRASSASHFARDSRCCISSGDWSPACSVMVQQFLRGSSANSPSTNARARRRGSTLRKPGPIRIISSSSMPSHRPASTLVAAATSRSSRVATNRDDHQVAAPSPAPTRPRSRCDGRRPPVLPAVRMSAATATTLTGGPW
jgi:hypothetical protein